ncbi:MAG TPA: hypothetical protein VN578_11425 [Candidatus Binatia bacterium]|jgi:hypothetical protein|nr:hypothetical protein [Candidatus Binatia bacterium]
MKPKEIFSLIVRLIGLLFLYDALKAVPNAIASICLVFPHFFFRNLWPNLFLIGWPLLVAYWLIRGAPWLMRLAYGEQTKEEAAQGPKPAV